MKVNHKENPRFNNPDANKISHTFSNPGGNLRFRSRGNNLRRGFVLKENLKEGRLNIESKPTRSLSRCDVCYL